jgi:hypothetical protein
VSDDNLDQACNRLSRIVDPAQYKLLMWSRNEAPMFVRLCELLNSALDDRPDFELAEEGSTKDVKRYVLKIHGNRTIAVTLGLQKGCVILDAEAIARSRYLVKPDDPLCDDFEFVDETWMAAALSVLFSRIEPNRRETDAAPKQAYAEVPKQDDAEAA